MLSHACCMNYAEAIIGKSTRLVPILLNDHILVHEPMTTMLGRDNFRWCATTARQDT